MPFRLLKSGLGSSIPVGGVHFRKAIGRTRAPLPPRTDNVLGIRSVSKQGICLLFLVTCRSRWSTTGPASFSVEEKEGARPVGIQFTFAAVNK